MTDTARYTRSDFQTDQEVRWCPGCGDYTILAAVQGFLASLDVDREKHVFVSGIGCSSRFPYYVNAYGMHTVHGRAPAIATGVAVANPDLTVWVVTGDGDALSIGGNHLIHALRRNVNINILLFNNQIYGLTKGQFSPTSEVGKRTKTSPMGSIDRPFNPVSLALGSEASFVARTIDMDRTHTLAMLSAMFEHQGAGLLEIYQNCNVFNDKAFLDLTDKGSRDSNRIWLRDGEPIIFGPNDEYGVIVDSEGARVVEISSAGERNIHVHDASEPNPSVAFALSRLSYGPYGPTPLGVFRNVDVPDFGREMERQIAEAQKDKGPGDLSSLLRSRGTWEVS
ncbi:MAG: 2-oxoacid:ferredoxin oxidoreductase subunit beta [Acidimicrobiia bacterium]